MHAGSGKLECVTRKTVLADSDKREMVTLYADGAGIVQLARKFRVRTEQVNRVIEASGVTRTVLTANTPIERRLHDALIAAGIGFATQKRVVGRYVVDILVNQAPVIIEADGIVHRIRAGARQRDTERDAAHEAAGYRMFHFSGSEINTDAASCIRRVIEDCGLVADEDPVYEIRTKFSGPDHPRYVGGHQLVCRYCGEPFRAYRAKRKYCSHEHYVLGALKGKRHGPERIARSREVALAASKKAAEAADRRWLHQIKIESDPARERRTSPETWLAATLF